MGLGAAFWTKPHAIALDEPTNYLDPETVDALARALRNFRGGVIAVTHSQRFIDETCTEAWTVSEGGIAVSKLECTAGDNDPEALAPAHSGKACAKAASVVASTPMSAAAKAAAKHR